MSQPTDQAKNLADLMRRAQDGDRRAYAVLLQTIAPIVRRSVLRQLPSYQRQDTEDVVQDILMSLHVARATYDPERPFMPWLMGIARNRIADAARRRARRAAREEVVAQVPETISDDGANILMDGYGDPEALRHAINHLPQQQRRAVELMKLREMSLKEASAESGMSIGALKVAVHRAMGVLRAALGSEA